MAAYNWSPFINSQTINTGIWDDHLQPITSGDTNYTTAVVVYDEDLIPENTLLYFAFPDPNIYPLGDQNLIVELSTGGMSLSFTGVLSSPPAQNYPTEILSQTGIISYDLPGNSVHGLIDFSAPLGNVSTYTPFAGFFEKVYGNPIRNFESQNVSAVLDDSLLVSYFVLNKDQRLNDTEEFSTAGGQAQLVRTVLNLQTQELYGEQIGSDSGSLINFRVSSSKEGGLYRVGLVRGNDTPISASGAEIPMENNDSLFHVFLTKESAEGATQWLTELYAYNNTRADTVSGGDDFRARNRFFSILETEESIFVSGEFLTATHIEDTLIFRDSFFDTYWYSGNEPYYEAPLGGMYKMPMYHLTLYKVGLNGEVDNTLRVASTGVGLYGSFPAESRIFDIQGNLAWTFNYSAANDTVFELEYRGFDGTTEQAFIDFPAGKGVAILWLDTDLSIVDHWLIPYESLDDFDVIDINAILPYGGDTLLIQGSLGRGTTTTLDPFGDSEPFTTPSDFRSGFFAFYSAPDILTSTQVQPQKNSFGLYPNPSSEKLYVSGLRNKHAAFRIFDLSGRIVLEGHLVAGSPLDISGLVPGMYIFTATGEGYFGEKFVVQ